MAFNKSSYNNALAKAIYDRFSAQFPKGKKAEYKALAQKCGDPSLNALINRLLEEEARRKA